MVGSSIHAGPVLHHGLLTHPALGADRTHAGETVRHQTEPDQYSGPGREAIAPSGNLIAEVRFNDVSQWKSAGDREAWSLGQA